MTQIKSPFVASFSERKMSPEVFDFSYYVFAALLPS